MTKRNEQDTAEFWADYYRRLVIKRQKDVRRQKADGYDSIVASDWLEYAQERLRFWKSRK